MSTRIDVSAVVTTYNRSAMLAAALEALVSQNAGDVQYEIIVVDNNSTDDTRATVEACIARGHANVRYVFEPKRSCAHGRNAGIITARGDIIACTDDDVVVSDNWVRTIKRAFDENPDVAYVGGKILPRWPGTPPSWLTVDHWWPLALLDRGDDRFYVSAANPLCLPTANASFRRDVFSQFGLLAPLSAAEDHEMYLRLWRAGVRGLYEPALVVTAIVQPERCLKSYHRRWNFNTGKFNALLRIDDLTTSDGRIQFRDSGPSGLTLFGVPGFMYRQFVTQGLGWLRESVRGNESRKLQHENRLCYLAGYVSNRYGVTRAQANYSTRDDVASFFKSLFAKAVRKTASANG